MNYYIADCHFGHKNILRFDQRPFADPYQMEETMIMLWNAAVRKEDTVYILGDFCWGKADEWLRILRQLNGSKVLIEGNHEQMMLDTFCSNDPHRARRLWNRNGGGNTYRTMMYRLSKEQRMQILRFIQKLPDHLEIEVGGNNIYMVHGSTGETRYERIWGRPEPPPEEPPMPGKTVIVGHTATYWMDFVDDRPFKIWYGPDLIDIDCGCGSGSDMRRSRQGQRYRNQQEDHRRGRKPCI